VDGLFEKLQEMDEFIRISKKSNKESTARGDLFSRSCSICSTVDPLQRVVSVECGHVVCRECGGEQKTCSVCKTKTLLVPLFENEICSRECAVCFEEPFERVFYKGCGHVICCACAIQIRVGAVHVCPFCR
ncbi:hypothetical protein PENTCL1PPCAC_1684, partial [Pristionchus entomophagus]